MISNSLTTLQSLDIFRNQDFMQGSYFLGRLSNMKKLNIRTYRFMKVILKQSTTYALSSPNNLGDCQLSRLVPYPDDLDLSVRMPQCKTLVRQALKPGAALW